MKDIKTIKDEVASAKGYNTWDFLIATCCGYNTPQVIYEAESEVEKILNERNSVDEAEKPCEHNWVSSVAYKGAMVCSMCGDYR